jgi:hypothetical protein
MLHYLTWLLLLWDGVGLQAKKIAAIFYFSTVFALLLQLTLKTQQIYVSDHKASNANCNNFSFILYMIQR